LMALWEAFESHGIKPPYPQQEIFIRNEQLTAVNVFSGGDHDVRELVHNS
jgi:small-conductance mechanosensitive channel